MHRIHHERHEVVTVVFHLGALHFGDDIPEKDMSYQIAGLEISIGQVTGKCYSRFEPRVTFCISGKRFFLFRVTF